MTITSCLHSCSEMTASVRAEAFVASADGKARSGCLGGKPISPLLNAIETAVSQDDLTHAIVPRIQRHFDVQHVIYHWADSDGHQFGWGTYPAEWVSRYLEQGYVRVDPVVLACNNCFHPVDWRRLNWSSVSARKFLADALANGIGRQGYSIPMRGPRGQFALFTVNGSCDDAAWSDFLASRTQDLILLTYTLNCKALELLPERVPQVAKRLCKRELDVLTLLAKGHGRAEAAAILKISDSTLRTYLETARSKLSAANTTQAVAVAVRHGMILI